MKLLLIQYTVLYSKAGYAPAAMILNRLLTEYKVSYMQPRPELALQQLQQELAYLGAPTWLYNSLVWHIAEMHEKVQCINI